MAVSDDTMEAGAQSLFLKKIGKTPNDTCKKAATVSYILEEFWR